MTAEERKEFAQELLDSNMSQVELEKYLEGPMQLSPKEWMEVKDDFRKDAQENNEDPESGEVSTEEMNEYLDDTFPKEPEPEEKE